MEVKLNSWYDKLLVAWLALAGIGFMVETALQSGQRWMMIMWKHVVHENDDAYEK